MQKNWLSRFSDNIKGYEGYSIGKLFKLLNDPEMISLAGGLPSPDIFLKDDLQRISQQRLKEDADTIMQYTDISGEMAMTGALGQGASDPPRVRRVAVARDNGVQHGPVWRRSSLPDSPAGLVPV